jgi:hypothetical protein
VRPHPASYDPLRYDSSIRRPSYIHNEIQTASIIIPGSRLDVSVVSHSKDKPVLNVDDDKLYVIHDEGKGAGKWEEPEVATAGMLGANINSFHTHIAAESSSSSSSEEKETSSDEVRVLLGYPEWKG